jgi:hypothetical protein
MLDWEGLDKAVNKERTSYEYEQVKHLFRKCAFDAYKPLNGSEQLWELRDGEDGKKYLVALYEEAEDIVATASTKFWKATPDSRGNVTLAYKDFPIMLFTAANAGYEVSEAAQFAEYLEKKASIKEFERDLVSNLPQAKKEVLVRLMSEGK